MEKLIPQLEKAIQVIAAKLGVAAEVIWNSLMAQALIMAKIHQIYMWIWGILAAIFVLGVILCAIWAFKENEEGFFGGVFGFGLGAVIFIAGTIEEYRAYMTCTKNPAYWALSQILDKIK